MTTSIALNEIYSFFLATSITFQRSDLAPISFFSLFFAPLLHCRQHVDMASLETAELICPVERSCPEPQSRDGKEGVLFSSL